MSSAAGLIPTAQQAKSSKFSVVAIIIYAVGALLAGYLSWSCNSAWRRGLLTKLVCALFAASGSWGYAMAYFWYKKGLCNPEAFQAAGL